MPLPTALQKLLRQYDNSELDWRGFNNQQLLDKIAQWGTQNRQHHYVHSRQFVTDMRMFSNNMYTLSQLQTSPAPNPIRILKNAIQNIRKRI